MAIRKRFSNGFKAKAALSAIKEDKTLAELSSEFGVHSTQITKWKKKLLEQAPDLFSHKDEGRQKEKEQLIENLYKHIGQLQVECDWLKKIRFLNPAQRISLIDKKDKTLSLRNQ